MKRANRGKYSADNTGSNPLPSPGFRQVKNKVERPAFRLGYAQDNFPARPKNIGREEQWWSHVQPDAQQAKVPWVIEDYFPWYDGVVWYWKRLAIPDNSHKDGRTLLKFWAVDFKADVWLNGKYLGHNLHE